MQPDFWLERWRLGQTAFHQTAVERQLEKHWARLQVDEGGVFVPLCGKSLDLLWLRDLGLQVTGVELSAVAVETFCLEQGVLARRQPGDDFDLFESSGIRLYRSDIYRLRREHLGPVQAVYDRASLIAFTPDSRARYVQHMCALTTQGTKTLLITVDYPQHQMSGPPFAVSAADVEDLYGKNHAIELLERRDILSEEARLRSRGVEELHMNSHLLTRR